MTRKDRFADMLEKGANITPESEQVEVTPRRPAREKRMFGSRVDAALFDEFEFALLEVKRERGLRRATKEAGLEALLSLLDNPDFRKEWAERVVERSE